jgi:hydrogenase-1 operon protein HyaF
MATVNSFNIPIEITQASTGMAQAVLFEIAEYLQDLAENGQRHVIDLSSLPMSDVDKQELETLLGTGEVRITLQTIGESSIHETRYSGVWWIKHYNPERQLLSELLEIARIPEIVQSHPEDIRQSAQDIRIYTQTQPTGNEL